MQYIVRKLGNRGKDSAQDHTATATAFFLCSTK